MAAILGETNMFFENWDGYSAETPCGPKFFVEIALSSTVFEI